MNDVLLGRASRFSTDDGEPMALDPALPAEIFALSGNPTAELKRVGGVLARSKTEKPLAPKLRRRQRERARDEEILPRGTIVDKYRIDALLGKGGFAVVYRATHLLLGTQVALKLLRPKILARQPALETLLCEEARFAARINHPNVARILDVTSVQSLTYIVMEYIDGCSLAEQIDRSGPLAPAAVLRIGLQVTAGLRAGLEQGLIHRDIKPENILVAKSGDAKIVDFGLAHQSVASSDVRSTRSRSVIGTYGYMSPEQTEDSERIDFRSDIYSLGVTLYEASTGSPPFPIGDPANCVALHKTRPVPRPEERVPGFPGVVSSLLLWMLAKNPTERPASYDALHSALSRMLSMGVLGEEADRLPPSGRVSHG